MSEAHWLQINKQSPRDEEKEARQAINAMVEDAKKVVEAKEEKIRIALQKQYGD